MGARSVRLALVAALIGATLTAGGPARALTGCASPDHPGGEWRTYGHDLSNTRSQPLEDKIGPAEAAELEVGFALRVTGLGGTGQIQSSPVIADGCLYAATDQGWVFAVNADDGQLSWIKHFDVKQPGLGGDIVGSVAVHDGIVYVPVSEMGRPYLAALAQETGEVLWEAVVEDAPGAFLNASPVVFGDMIFMGFSSFESSPSARGGFTILDRTSGAVLKRGYTIPDDEYAAGHAGASIWATAVVDMDTMHAYTATGNPASKRLESKYSNAIIKIDVDPERSTFGEMVASYKGDPDQYLPGAADQPACQYFGEHPALQLFGAWSATCLQQDLDFGASPNLFTDARGRKMVGALQKTGVFHTAYASTMERAWTAIVGTPCFPCNAASSAFDGKQIIGVSVVPGQMYALRPDNGFVNWMAPILDGEHYQPTSVANGVAYTVDTKGFFQAVDTATGFVVASRPITLDAGGSGGLVSSGVAIARNTIYAASGGFLVAYR